MKNSKQLERYFKGVANHWRIDIVRLLMKNPGLTLQEIANRLDANFKTISEHTRRLVAAGLINKKYEAQMVRHELSPYGKIMHRIFNAFK